METKSKKSNVKEPENYIFSVIRKNKVNDYDYECIQNTNNTNNTNNTMNPPPSHSQTQSSPPSLHTHIKIKL